VRYSDVEFFPKRPKGNLTILVTGGAGFIGMHTSLALQVLGHKVIAYDNFETFYSVALKRARVAQLRSSGVTFVQGDLCDATLLGVTLIGVDRVINLAAQAGVRYSLKHPFKYTRNNVECFVTLLEALKSRDIPLLYASSSSVYGLNTKVPFSESDPVLVPASLYAATKRADELTAHVYNNLYGQRSLGFRFFTVYGPWGRPDMAYWTFTKKILAGEPIQLYSHGDQKRDFTYIDDIVAGIVAAIDVVQNMQADILNLGNHQTVGVRKFVQVIEKALGKKAVIEEVPAQPGDVPQTFADVSRAKQLLGYDPKTPLELGIPKFVAWYATWDEHAATPADLVKTTQQCPDVIDKFLLLLKRSPLVSDTCRAHVSMQASPALEASAASPAARYFLQCEREALLQKLASRLCKRPSSSGDDGGMWDIRQVQRVYSSGKVWKAAQKEHNRVEVDGPPGACSTKCCSQETLSDNVLVECLRSCRPGDLETIPVTDPAFTRLLYKVTNGTINSAIDFGSGKGNWMSSLGRAGVETTVGVEPSFMGSLALYSDSWDSRTLAVQVDAMIGTPEGDTRFEAFMCERFGSVASYQFDLVWSVETFEHVPQELHCELINTVAAYSREWAFTSIAPKHQSGHGHISSHSREEWLKEWEARGFQLSTASADLVKTATWIHFTTNALLLRRVGPPRRVKCVDPPAPVSPPLTIEATAAPKTHPPTVAPLTIATLAAPGTHAPMQCSPIKFVPRNSSCESFHGYLMMRCFACLLLSQTH
jgi:UDP-glucuronate 4-epimerase